MITPDSETAGNGDDLLFVRRWNILVNALIAEPSVKLVARTAADFGLRDGEGVYPGNQRLARQTGLSEEAVRTALAVLRAFGMARLDVPSHWNGKRRDADRYALQIPPDWRGLPVYGPSSGRFHCQHCGKAFNPQPGTHLRKDGTVGFYLRNMIFCPDPGRPKRTAAERQRRSPLRRPRPAATSSGAAARSGARSATTPGNCSARPAATTGRHDPAPPSHFGYPNSLCPAPPSHFG